MRRVWLIRFVRENECAIVLSNFVKIRYIEIGINEITRTATFECFTTYCCNVAGIVCAGNGKVELKVRLFQEL